MALAAITAAMLHGPALAGLGLVGALATPLLVSSERPNPWPVVFYLAVVVSAAYALARLRRWLWLAAAAAIGAGLWTLLLDANSPVTGVDAAYGLFFRKRQKLRCKLPHYAALKGCVGGCPEAIENREQQ